MTSSVQTGCCESEWSWTQCLGGGMGGLSCAVPSCDLRQITHLFCVSSSAEIPLSVCPEQVSRGSPAFAVCLHSLICCWNDASTVWSAGLYTRKLQYSDFNWGMVLNTAIPNSECWKATAGESSLQIFVFDHSLFLWEKGAALQEPLVWFRTRIVSYAAQIQLEST